MNVFSFHLANCGMIRALGSLVRPPVPDSTPGLIHAECMVPMTLGRPVALPARYRAMADIASIVDVLPGNLVDCAIGAGIGLST